ncbi:MAG: 2-oxoglutarate dehydrogenase E1 component [Phycisphaerales bacterium]
MNNPPASSSSLKGNVAAVNGWNAEYLEAQYARFREDPASVPDDLRSFLQGFDLALGRGAAPSAPTSGVPAGGDLRVALGVRSLIDAYRRHGHLVAALDPFGRPRPLPASLDLKAFGLSEADLDRPAAGHDLPLAAHATLRQAIDFLRGRYCGSTGYEFMHCADENRHAWFLSRIERGGERAISREDRLEIVRLLAQSEQIETFLQKRYQGQKRFSLEGGESLIPLLDWVLRTGAEAGVQEVAMGMPHRGRINVLNNVVGKSYEQIFTEFEHNYRDDFVDGGGDVKYHRGYSGDRELPGGRTIHVTLASNPSHLESVNAVVCGRARAKQRLRGDTEARKVVLPVLVHGDGAVIGQGVVAEVLNMSGIEGYTCGGSVHVVVNNLVAFTTDPEDDRSSTYCTDIGLMIQAPVIHVNGDDPEAVVAAARLAVEYRQTFGRDIFIDMWCYRKYGHNETDNASFTQPALAELIKNDTGVLSHYTRRLEGSGQVSAEEYAAIRARLDAALEAAQERAKKNPHPPNIEPAGRRWKGIRHEYSFEEAKTSVSAEMIREVCAALGRVPDGFTPNPGLKRLLASRAGLADDLGKEQGPATLSYADAESLAYGTLLLEGIAVRVSGQDSRRGTFSHRHAVLRDFHTGEKYTPLNSMRPVAVLPDDAGKQGPDGKPTQARLCVYDSPLSEYSVMGFDYGYSMADPHMLVCWEAQFGDFCNTAQVMIDQYLASAEIKWDRWSGLVLLLPHGYEGAGPEHSSARMERFLQLCANENMEVVYPSTGAQVFHMLRRQVKRSFRKPLIVMTPKSMLRPPTSRMDELVTGRFREVIDDPHFEAHKEQRKSVSRVMLCSGKFYHELHARREATKRHDTALVRIEQLYPLHVEQLREVIGRYPARSQFIWAQEEPRNAGAYLYMDDAFRTRVGIKGASGLTYIGRDASATPAIGDTHMSDEQQEAVLTQAIGPAPVSSGHASAGGKAPSKPAAH